MKNMEIATCEPTGGSEPTGSIVAEGSKMENMEIVNIEQFKQFKFHSVARQTPIMTDQMMAVLLLVDSNSSTLELNHPQTDKIYYVIQGSGVVTVDEESGKIKMGDMVLIHHGHNHRYTTTGESLILLTMRPV